MDPIRVTELKQWVYCQRIVYFHQILPGVGRATYKMEAAVDAQALVETLELRRTFREYGMDRAERRFGVWLEDENLGLSGKVDLVLWREEECAPVDFKLTAGQVGENHRMQVTGYALLLEKAWQAAVRVGFLYRIPDGRVFPFEITLELREKVMAALAAIRRLRETQVFPDPTEVRGRCTDCEYAAYCADIW